MLVVVVVVVVALAVVVVVVVVVVGVAVVVVEFGLVPIYEVGLFHLSFFGHHNMVVVVEIGYCFNIINNNNK